MKAAGFDDISVRGKSLSITVDQLASSFRHCIKKVQDLNLHFIESISTTELQFIASWISSSNLGIKELSIHNYNVIIPPLIESSLIADNDIITLNGLNISAYSNLRCLKLRSLSIEDVSRLDGIHELHLLCCNKIQDISFLNDNYKIVIDECNGITDYSNSFRYSKILHM